MDNLLVLQDMIESLELNGEFLKKGSDEYAINKEEIESLLLLQELGQDNTKPKKTTKAIDLVPPSVKYMGQKNMPITMFDLVEEGVKMKKAKVKASDIKYKIIARIDKIFWDNKNNAEWHEPLAYSVLWYNSNMPSNISIFLDASGDGNIIKQYNVEFSKIPIQEVVIKRISESGFLKNKDKQALSGSFASKDELRPVWTFTQLKYGYATSTDANTLLAIYDKDLIDEDKLMCYSSGCYGDTDTGHRFPMWQQIVPTAYQIESIKINAGMLLGFLANVKKYKVSNSTTKKVYCKIGEITCCFNYELLHKCVDAITKLGGEDVYIKYRLPNQPFIFCNSNDWDLNTPNSTFVIAMPIMLNDDDDSHVTYNLNTNTITTND